MDPRSEANLAQVYHPLAAVARAALQTPQPFEVTYGLRSYAAEVKAVAEHHSQTLHSYHLAQPRFGGLATAFDITCFVDGVALEVGPEVAHVYAAAAEQILAAAETLGIKVQWGGAKVGAWIDGVVSHFPDYGHFQVDPSDYARLLALPPAI